MIFNIKFNLKIYYSFTFRKALYRSQVGYRLFFIYEYTYTYIVYFTAFSTLDVRAETGSNKEFCLN